MKILFTALCISAFIVSSCSDLPGEWEEMSIDDIAWEIEREVGSAGANTPQECKTIPIGATINGTPRGHLVYSERSSDKSKLSALVSIYNEMDEKRNKQENTPMVFQEISRPSLELTNGTCRGTNRFAWNPGDISRFHAQK